MSIDYHKIAEELTDIDVINDPIQIQELSLDYYYFSPILQSKLANKKADLVVRPKTEQEVVKVAQVCVNNRVPLTIRGAGTGNYGQCIPLNGGIVLDISEMRKIKWIKSGVACVEPGIKMGNLDRETRKQGWELRMFPSTYKIATIGGFIGGGSAGIGSINYGQLRDRGNVRRAKVISLEDQPRVIELKGDQTQQINHAYGTNGIITELEIPLAPAHEWQDIIIVFADFMEAVKFGQALSDSDGIVKKLVSIHAAPIPEYFTALKDYFSQGQHCALVIIDRNSLLPLTELVKEYHGEITYPQDLNNPENHLSVIEFTWNHTTLLARNIDDKITYLQTFFFNLEQIEKMYRHFGDEVMIHLEFLRVGGKAIPAGLQLVRFTTESRLNEIIEYHEQNGASIANPHTYILEDGGRKKVEPEQLEFKQIVDPYGLLNQGKMRSWKTN